MLGSASPRDRLLAADLQGKYGIGTKTEIETVSPEVVGRLERQFEIINARDTWTREELNECLTVVWET